MKKPGILINDKLTKALIDLAISDGFIVPQKENKLKESSVDLKQELLSTLLIFGKLHVRTNSNTFRQELTDNHNAYSAKELINQDIIKIHRNRDNQENLDIELMLTDFQDKRDLVILNLESKSNLTSQNISNLNKCYDKSINLIEQFITKEESFFQNDARISSVSDFIPYHKFILTQEIGHNFPELYNQSVEIVKSYNEINYYINFSTEQNLPAKTYFNSKQAKEFITDYKPTDEQYRLYQIILEEDCTFPFPRTLSSAIELINDNRIVDFRNLLTLWMNNLKNGDTIDELKVRREIQKAKKSLEKVSSNKKVARIVSYVSLPVGVASAIMGIPAGIILTPVGPILNLKNHFTKKKNNWLLLGKY